MKTLLVLPFVLILVGCAANEPMRSDKAVSKWDMSDCSVDPEQRTFQERALIEVVNPGTDSEFSLGFIEFDDQGALHDYLAKAYVLDYLKEEMAEPSIVVVFTHGWHHNAFFQDGNVVSFRGMLAGLARKFKDRNIVGLYLGWRGDSFLVPWVNALTYWDRSESAHQVGFSATPIFTEIESIVKTPESSPHNILVTVGHSFGGLITYTALAPVLQSRYMVDRQANADNVGGFGDLVVLINPAFPAQLHLPLFNLAQEGCGTFSEQQPKRLVIVSSTADRAVR